jgi:hypothetical protein
MAIQPELIYCADGNSRFAQIAIDASFTYGAQLPNTVYFPVEFADQNWKAPDRARYMAALAEHKPRMATVLDLERPEQLSEVLAWAEEAATHVLEAVLIVPKYSGAIANLPRRIGGKEVRLAYSVPTKFGGTDVPTWEFASWPIHLLGGSPHRQIYLARQAMLNVVSVDGNMATLMATRYCQFWAPGNARYASNRWWPTMREANNGNLWGDGSSSADAPYEAFRRSCENIKEAWSTA